MKLVNKNKVESLLKKDAILIDLRNPVSFRDGSVPGAVNLPLRNFCNRLPALDKKKAIVIYSDKVDDPDVKAAINYATQMGFAKLFVTEYKQLIEETPKSKIPKPIEKENIGS